MLGFIGRWLSDGIRIGLAVAGAAVAMQLPALTHEFRAGLAQTAEAADRDIAARIAQARDHYALTGGDDDAIVQLAQREPANADGLRDSRARAQALRGAAARIDTADPFWRPVAAAAATWDAPEPVRAVLSVAVETWRPVLLLDAAAALWALIGLFAGALAANALLGLLAAPFRPGRRAAAS